MELHREAKAPSGDILGFESLEVKPLLGQLEQENSLKKQAPSLVKNSSRASSRSCCAEGQGCSSVCQQNSVNDA